MGSIGLPLLLLVALGGVSAGAVAEVEAPPVSLALDPFYARYVDADGIPILSSAKVPDRALLVAKAIVEGMLAHRPDLARALAASGYRVAIMAEDESTLDLPEQRDWKKPARDDPRLTRCERKHYD